MGQAAADLPARWAGNTLGKGQGGSGESKLFPAIVALPSPLTSPGGGRLVSPKLLTASPPTYPHLQGCLQARPQRWQRWPSAWSLGLHPLINALTLSYQGRRNLLQPSFPDTVSLQWCHFRSGLCGGQRPPRSPSRCGGTIRAGPVGRAVSASTWNVSRVSPLYQPAAHPRGPLKAFGRQWA